MHPLQVGLTCEPQKRVIGGSVTAAQRGHTITAARRRTHQCPRCYYSTMHRSHLREHYRTHTGERPFACPDCLYQAATNRDLKKHTRTHTGEKRFSCPHCLYRSATSSNLKKHNRTHHTASLCGSSVPVALKK